MNLNIGLSKQNYKVFTTNKETITRIELPLNEKIAEHLDFLSEDFVRTQTTIPVIKKNLAEVNKLLNAPELSIPDLLEFFSKDVTLSFLLLKDVIAAKKRCCSLLDAIDYHGIIPRPLPPASLQPAKSPPNSSKSGQRIHVGVILPCLVLAWMKRIRSRIS